MYSCAHEIKNPMLAFPATHTDDGSDLIVAYRGYYNNVTFRHVCVRHLTRNGRCFVLSLSLHVSSLYLSATGPGVF